MPIEPTPSPRRIKVKGRTAPSSTRKKLVKPGNPKFRGERSLKSELREDADTRWRELSTVFRSGLSPEDYAIELASASAARRNLGKKAPRLPGRRGERKLRGFVDTGGPEFGRGTIAQNPRVKQLFMRLIDRYLGGGQEFDVEY